MRHWIGTEKNNTELRGGGIGWLAKVIYGIRNEERVAPLWVVKLWDSFVTGSILPRVWIFHFPECYPSWTINNNIYSPGAYSIGLMTLIECQNRCVEKKENPNCVAIDHNYNDGTCWIQEKASDLTTQYKWTAGNQYVLKNRCDVAPTSRE